MLQSLFLGSILFLRRLMISERLYTFADFVRKTLFEPFINLIDDKKNKKKKPDVDFTVKHLPLIDYI